MRDEHPRVSVLIPAHNAAPWIRQTLDSVLCQTAVCTEVLVVDDGSTDETAEIVRGVDDARLRLLVQPASGVCAARNHALSASRGEYVQYLDADDLLSRDKIEQQVQLLDLSPSGCVAVCDTVHFADGSAPDDGRSLPGGHHLDSDDGLQWLLDLWTPPGDDGAVGWSTVALHAWMTPRSVLEAAGPWDVHISQDTDGEYFTRVLNASRGVRWTPGARAYYRRLISTGSMSAAKSAYHLSGRLRAAHSKRTVVLGAVPASARAQAEVALANYYFRIAYDGYPNHPLLVAEAEQCMNNLGGIRDSFYLRDSFHRRHAVPLLRKVLGWKTLRRLGRLRG